MQSMRFLTDIEKFNIALFLEPQINVDSFDSIDALYEWSVQRATKQKLKKMFLIRTFPNGKKQSLRGDEIIYWSVLKCPC